MSDLQDVEYPTRWTMPILQLIHGYSLTRRQLFDIWKTSTSAKLIEDALAFKPVLEENDDPVYHYIVKHKLITPTVVKEQFERWLNKKSSEDHSHASGEYNLFMFKEDVPPTKEDIRSMIEGATDDHFDELFEKVRDIILDKLTIEGLNVFTWPCHSPFNGYRFVVGKELNEFKVESGYKGELTLGKKGLSSLGKLPSIGIDLEEDLYLLPDPCEECEEEVEGEEKNEAGPSSK